MGTLNEYWPPSGVRITEGDLGLSVLAADDYAGLVDVIHAGVHHPDAMPFMTPWTTADPEHLAANSIRFFASTWANFTPASFDLIFAVRLGGELAGVQGFHTKDFALTRTGETGSWLGLSFQGRGLGTRMRRAVCAFAFDELGATEITSGAFTDNPASLAVSRKVGYRFNGQRRMKRREAECAVNQQLVLTTDTFVRGEPIEVTGAAALRSFLELDGPDAQRTAGKTAS